MNAAIAILLQLRAADGSGLAAQWLLDGLRLAAHDLTLPELEAELRGLADKGWVLRYEAGIAGVRWRITGQGKSQLQEARL